MTLIVSTSRVFRSGMNPFQHGWPWPAVSACLLAAVCAADEPAADRAIRVKSPRAADVYSEARVALVIGNGAYTAGPLVNPSNDAEDMARALRARKFDVDCVINADRRRMREAIATFGKRLKQGGIGVFYYAGHGAQRDGRNYLFPVGVEITSAQDVEDNTIGVNQVLSAMEAAGNRLNILILDACRNNPYPEATRSAAAGLAAMKAPAGTLIAFATAEGRVAAEGTGRNGVYTKHLLQQLCRPGLKAEDLFKAVRVGVKAETSDKQVPFDYSSLTGEFFFTPVDFDDGRMALTEEELKRLRQLEEEQRRADEERERIEEAARVKQAALEQEVARLRAQLKVQSNSTTLDAIEALAAKREQVAAQFREAERRAAAERKKREAEIAQLEATERANRRTRFFDRYGKYTRMAGSRFLNDDEKTSAWKAICDEWLVLNAGARPGELTWDEENGCVVAGAGASASDGGDALRLDLGDGVAMLFVRAESLKGWVGKYEVTNQEFRRFRKDHDSGKNEGKVLNAERQPAVQVSYNDAAEFAEWVNSRAGSSMPAGCRARLPDGGEWTAFAQCGDGRVYPWGNDWPPRSGNYADMTAKKSFPKWITIEDYDDGAAVNCPVEESGGNPWGLHGVGGNVWEWTSEEDGSSRVARGGSCDYGKQTYLRCDSRIRLAPSTRDDTLGFRLVLMP
jgi:uncharacterized caspase-like protein